MHVGECMGLGVVDFGRLDVSDEKKLIGMGDIEKSTNNKEGRP